MEGRIPQGRNHSTDKAITYPGEGKTFMVLILGQGGEFHSYGTRAQRWWCTQDLHSPDYSGKQQKQLPSISLSHQINSQQGAFFWHHPSAQAEGAG